MGNERFGLYGLIPKERDFNKSEDFEKQRAGEGDVLIYETDNTEEARAIYEAGGFERKGSGMRSLVSRIVPRAGRRMWLQACLRMPVRFPASAITTRHDRDHHGHRMGL